MQRRLLSGVLIFCMIVLLSANSAFAAPLLKVGSRGDDVKAMQQKLIELGYLKGKADGIFGPLTRDAVIRFQQAKGLTVDGIAGPNTLNALYGTSSSPSNTPPAQAPESKPSGSVPTRVLKVGTRGDDVKQLQSKLNELGYPCGAVDGVFGNATRTAVMNFQKANGLTVDGIAGPATLAKLFKDSPAANPPNNPPGSGSSNQGSKAPITQTLKMGSTGEQVKILQSRLNELGYSVGTADGIFGAKTRNAVIAFQKDNGLAADGIVGQKTIEKLFANSSTKPKPSEPPKGDENGNGSNNGLEEFHGTPGELIGKTIILDPGHGGSDVGANRDGVYEKNINLDIALRLKRMLEEAGATVLMTRTTDQFYSLYYRAAFANKYILDSELNKKLQEKESKEKEYSEKTEQRVAKEIERLEKLARISNLERLLAENKVKELQMTVEINNLSNKKLSIEQDWKIKKGQHEQKILEQQQTSQELDGLKERLQNLNTQKSNLGIQIQDLLRQKSQLETLNQQIAANIANIQNEMAELKKRIDSPDVDPQTKIQLQQQYNAKETELRSLQAQLSSNEQACAQIDIEKESKEREISQIDNEISIVENDIITKQRRLDTINNELKIVESLANAALEALESVQEELKSKEQDLEQLRKDITSMENELPVLKNDVKQLEKDIPALEQELHLLDAEIRKVEAEANEIKSKGELFATYLNNPALESRTGIYRVDYDSVNNKNRINEELKAIFDLTRANYDHNTIFISIHCNSTAEQTTNASGVQAYYRDNGPYSSWGTYGVNTDYYKNYNAEKREKLARSLLKHATENAGFSGRYSNPYKQDFAVLRETNIVSVLMEIGFINNPNDRKLLLQEQTRENVAKGLYKGIVEYFR